MSYKQPARLELVFQDGTRQAMDLKEVLVLKVPGGIEEVAFRLARDGVWRMLVTESLLQGRKLADNFLTVCKAPEDAAREHLQPYTVLTMYPDYMAENYGEDTHTTTVWARDPKHAWALSVEEVEESHPGELQCPEDMAVVGMWYGHATLVDPAEYEQATPDTDEQNPDQETGSQEGCDQESSEQETGSQEGTSTQEGGLPEG